MLDQTLRALVSYAQTDVLSHPPPVILLSLDVLTFCATTLRERRRSGRAQVVAYGLRRALLRSKRCASAFAPQSASFGSIACCMYAVLQCSCIAVTYVLVLYLGACCRPAPTTRAALAGVVSRVLSRQAPMRDSVATTRTF